MSKVWFITGSGSGIGAGTAKAAGGVDSVVATGRNLDKVRDAYRDVFPSRESDALTVVTPVLEAQLQEMHTYEELSKSTDGTF